MAAKSRLSIRREKLKKSLEISVPKEKIFALMDEIADIEVKAPVKIGDIIVKDILGTGADIMATKNVDRKGNFLYQKKEN